MTRFHSPRAAFLALGFLVLVLRGALAQSQCAARVPTLSSLKAEFTPEELAFLNQILPKPTSTGGHAVRAEIRAPLHIPCQMKSFPHILAFQDQEMARDMAFLTIAAVAQPPHVLLYDASDRLVRTIPIAPAWTKYQLRDLITEVVVHS